jgi:hypothetical protein
MFTVLICFVSVNKIGDLYFLVIFWSFGSVSPLNFTTALMGNTDSHYEICLGLYFLIVTEECELHEVPVPVTSVNKMSVMILVMVGTGRKGERGEWKMDDKATLHNVGTSNIQINSLKFIKFA